MSPLGRGIRSWGLASGQAMFRRLDLVARKARRVERVPRPLIDEALRLMALLNRRGAG
ncbi:MAG: hypothetical protein ACK5JG_14185 [Pseudomonadota bacterium]